MTRYRAACDLAIVTVFVMASANALSAQARQASPRYAGRPVIEVLQDLNTRGLRIVFSTVLVKPTFRVATEPAGPSPSDILDQVLRPHGLEAQRRANGVLVVARAARPRSAPKPAPVRPGTLHGRVVDASTEQPLASVLVVVQRPERRTTTDAEGRFEFEGLEVLHAADAIGRGATLAVDATSRYLPGVAELRVYPAVVPSAWDAPVWQWTQPVIAPVIGITQTAARGSRRYPGAATVSSDGRARSRR